MQVVAAHLQFKQDAYNEDFLILPSQIQPIK